MNDQERRIWTTPDHLRELGGNSHEARILLDRFVNACRMPAEHGEEVDFATSLIVMTATRFGADLHVPADLDELGVIFRTGLGSPYVYGRQVKLDAEIITDPLLQRAGCLYLSRGSAIQDIIEHLIALPTSAPDWGTIAERVREFLTNPDGKGDLPATAREICGSFFKAQTKLLSSIETALAAIKARRGAEIVEPADAEGGDRITALKRATESLELAHLGKQRLERLPPHGSSVVIQGAGDLSFNSWNVAFYRRQGRTHTFIPEGEPYSQRRYRCIVHWNSKPATPTSVKALADHVRRNNLGGFIGDSLAILELEVAPERIFVPAGRESHRSDGPSPEPARDITDLVDFAIYGKSVIWNGEMVAKHEVVDQFNDLRHVFQLPNLNSKEAKQEQQNYFFGTKQDDDFWLLEAILLSDVNLCRLACYAPISVPLDRLGARRDQIDVGLKKLGYRKQGKGGAVRQQGEYAWVGQVRPHLVIFLRPAHYPCSIVGIGGEQAAPDSLYLLAWGHDFDRGLIRIWEDCGELLRSLGARYALVMDEGQDVFQVHVSEEEGKTVTQLIEEDESAGDLREFMPVPFAFSVKNGRRCLKRTAMRASLAFWDATRS